MLILKLESLRFQLYSIEVKNTCKWKHQSLTTREDVSDVGLDIYLTPWLDDNKSLSLAKTYNQLDNKAIVKVREEAASCVKCQLVGRRLMNPT